MNPQDHTTCQSSNAESATATESRRGAGRQPVLDEGKQQQILAILTAGGSRRTAARYIGCAPGTITQTAQRDTAFAEQLAHAEQSAEILMLRLINKAASQEKYWRAAAWILERRNPEDFALRKPETFTAQQVQEQVATVLDLVLDAVPSECRAQVVEKLECVSAEIDARVWPAGWNDRGDHRHVAADAPAEETPATLGTVRGAEESCPWTHESQSLSQNRRGLAHFAESSEQNVPVPFSAHGFGIGSQAKPQDAPAATCASTGVADSPRSSESEGQPISEHPTSGRCEVASDARGASTDVPGTCARATRRNRIGQRRRRAKIGKSIGRRRNPVSLLGNPGVGKRIPI